MPPVDANKLASGYIVRVAVLFALVLVLSFLIVRERWLLAMPVGFGLGWSVRDLYLFCQRW